MEKKRRRNGRRKPAALRKRKSLTFRIRDQLRAQLERAATAAERSASEETEHRLMMSFQADDAFGGPAMRHMAILMAVAFHSAGSLSSGGKPVEQWISDPDVFRRAMFGTIYALFGAIPNVTDEDIAIEIEGLKGRLLTDIANRRAA